MTRINTWDAQASSDLKELMAVETTGEENKSITPETMFAAFIGGENIIAHGADHTGVASSKAAYLAAIAAAGAGGTVYFPAGTYNLSDFTAADAYLTQSISLYGAGRDLVTINVSSGADRALCTLNAADVTLTMRGLTLSGGNIGVTWTSGAGGVLDIAECRFDGQLLGGIRSPVSFYPDHLSADIHHNIFENICNTDAATSWACGINMRFTTSDFIRVTDNTIKNLGHAGHDWAIWGVYIHIKNTPSDMEGAAAVIISGNTITNISNSGVNESQLGGIDIHSRATIITGNTVRYLEQTALNIDCEAIYVKAMNSTISDNVVENAGGKEGCIALKGRTRGEVGNEDNPYCYSNIIANNNVVMRPGYRDGQASRGIQCYASDTLITGNLIEGCQEGGIRSSGANYQITGNTVCFGLDQLNTSLMIGIRGNGHGVITDNLVHNLTNTSGVYGIYAELTYGDAPYLVVTGNSVMGETHTSGTSYGVFCNINSHALGSLVVTNNQIDGYDYGLRLTNTTNSTMQLGANHVTNWGVSQLHMGGVGTCIGYIPDGIATSAIAAHFAAGQTTRAIQMYGKYPGKTALNTTDNTLMLALDSDPASAWIELPTV